MLDELMANANLSKTAIICTALLGSVAVYDEMTPPAATYFQQVQMESQYVHTDPDDDVGPFSHSKVETPILKSEHSGILVDLKKTPIPVPEYKVGPEDDNTSALSTYNFGLVNRSNN